MDMTFEILLLISFVGGFDLLYFHLYKFRLYKNPSSVAEEFTHLFRAIIFLLIVSILLFSSGSALARLSILVLFGLDTINNVADVLLEKKSRASIGGLPSLEYLIHILSAFLIGVAFATFWWYSSSSGFTPVTHSFWNIIRGIFLLVFGVGMFLFEGTLFLSSLLKRYQRKNLSRDSISI